MVSRRKGRSEKSKKRSGSYEGEGEERTKEARRNPGGLLPAHIFVLMTIIIRQTRQPSSLFSGSVDNYIIR